MISFALKRFLQGIPLILGVTLVSFLLMVHFGPDKTYDLLGKNPTAAEIKEVRQQLGYDQPFLKRYLDYLKNLATMNFGHSESTGEKVSSLFKRAIPVTLAQAIPGFVLGNVLGILLAFLAGFHRGKWLDKLIMAKAVVGMSLSFLIVIMAFQILFCSPYGLNLFPVQGWSTNSLKEYLSYVTVPTLATVFVSVGYNTRFYRAVIVEELNKDYVRTAQAYGASPFELLFKYVLKNCMVPMITRIVFTIPFIVIGGSLLIESYFGIPGVGLITFDAITSGDQAILQAVVGLTAVMYVLALTLTDILYKVVDPRISLR